MLGYLRHVLKMDLALVDPEFKQWRWVAPEHLVELIVPFKRDLYAAIVAEFTSQIDAMHAGSAQGGA